MLLLKLAVGMTEVPTVNPDGNVVYQVETENGDEGYLHEHKTILSAVCPKVLEYHHGVIFSG